MANVSEQDHELLSAYVDGMLTEEERLALEARLHSDADLLRELTALYLTLAMVKQLPTLTAPRNFTLPEEKSRWLVFPTSRTFTVLSAAAATFLVAIGAFLLTMTMNAGTAGAPPAANSDQEVALLSNTISGTAMTPTVGSLVVENVQTTATALAQSFRTTQSANFAATSAPTMMAFGTTVGAQGGALPMTSTVVDSFESDGTDEDSGVNDAADAAMVAPLSTGTPLPTVTFAPLASPVPDQRVADSADDTVTEAEAAVPAAEENTASAEIAMAQVSTETSTPAPTVTNTSLPTATSTVTPAPTSTLTPSATPVVSSTVSSGGIPAILGIALVLGGALLFGIAFMTAVTRRGNRIRSRKEE